MATRPFVADPALRIGAVHLAVADLPRSVDFYARVLGLSVVTEGGEEAILGDGARALVQLTRLTAPTPAPPRGAGLFHFALLHPGRAALAETVMRIATARWPISGASDHCVSEALYLDDPDGLGIEIYADRAREQWPRDDAGAIEMATLPLDLDGLLSTVAGDHSPRITPGTVVGHVHLRVADLERSVAFYRDALGLELQARMPSAAFLAAGGYHHHIGLNTWQSLGAAPVAPTTPGLRLIELQVSDAPALAAMAQRLRSTAVANARPNEQRIALHDPDRQALAITRAVEPAVSR